jgi:hypothetical protein
MNSSDDTFAGGGGPPEAPADPQAAAGRFQSPEVDSSGLVTITLFGRKYHIRSDRPELIFQLTYMIQSAVNEVQAEPSDSELAALDTLVQASFRLALRLHGAQGEEKALRENIEALEKKLQGLLDLIDRQAGPPAPPTDSA